MELNSFTRRHLGPRAHEVEEMAKQIGVDSMDTLIDETVPASIRLQKPLAIEAGLSESDYLNLLQEKASKNEVFKSYLGLGYYGTLVPAVIQRNVLENPGWYTAYTPYQAEIAQGRLEALLNFQTMVIDLTGMEIANASLLDEGTAGAEAMIMFYNNRSRAAVKAGVNKFFVSQECFPQTIAVLETRAEALNIEVVVGDHRTFTFTEEFFGATLQYPSGDGEVYNYEDFVAAAHAVDAKVAVGADLMALALLTPPGEWGADVVFGNTQRFGVPMGMGGPHAAYFATYESYKRNIPGRIIGVSVDREGRPALRMALQTREQHIRRDKATSNICTAQALLAVMAGMYAAWHGSEGIRSIATGIHQNAVSLANSITTLGYSVANNMFFDTIKVATSIDEQAKVRTEALTAKINLRYYEDGAISISLDETVTANDLEQLVAVFAKAAGKEAPVVEQGNPIIDGASKRTSGYLEHEVFNKYHSETEMMRYLKRLENRDLSLVHSMIPLGSCTMKLNAATELMPITWPAFCNIHPFVPVDQIKGYREIFDELDRDLSEITGFAKVSLQPNSGAQGEFAGLMVIRAYHLSRGDHQRNVVLIPSSAHGTNPASAVMAGMKVVVVKCDDNGNIDVADLKAKAEKHQNELSALMITYPSTHGVFEEAVIEITGIVHEHGGQVYMDGANMNAQCGLTNPGSIGADVCHLNLHKTFAIPHGGGGPGMGPIGVAAHLAPFLPSNPITATGGDQPIPAISAAPWGSALILLISYGYIKMLGQQGITDSTKVAILNANYLKARLAGHYDILYRGSNGHVAHEMILDCRDFKKNANIEVADIAKRLIDYGFHAPTVSFPVAGTLMIEPTESESKDELDRFADAMIAIREEIAEVERGEVATDNNVVINAPHTTSMILSDVWDFPYNRQKAATPLPYVAQSKFWPAVSKIDNAYGDRNLVCSCLPLEAYAEEFA